MADRDGLMEDGENQAVRMFLALYGTGQGIKCCDMTSMLREAGFDGDEFTPQWAMNDGHLTKDGAQSWIRHLFSMEASPQPAPHAIDDVRLTLARFGYSDESRGVIDLIEDAIIDLKRKAQPAAVEPAKYPPFLGFKTVPIEPTDAMLEYIKSQDCDGMPMSYKSIYMAMVSAAPSPAVAEPADPRCEKCGGSTCNICGIEGMVMCNDCDHAQDAEPARKAIDAQGVTADAMECLRDVVSHHGDFVKACELERGVAEGSDNESYWSKQIDVLNRMKEQAERALASPLPAATLGKAEHPDDAAVDAFAAELKSKLAKSREKGRGGWQECDPADLSRMLREHVEKGDPRDVANFCMFLWHLKAPIAQQPAASDALCTNWYCEAHPDKEMGHEGCSGAGIPESARIAMLLHINRLLKQEVREASQMRDVLASEAMALAKTASDVRDDAYEQAAKTIDDLKSKITCAAIIGTEAFTAGHNALANAAASIRALKSTPAVHAKEKP